jgi:hypothetical protein
MYIEDSGFSKKRREIHFDSDWFPKDPATLHTLLFHKGELYGFQVASERYRPIGCYLSAKLISTLVGKGCCAVSATDSCGR